MLNHNGIREKRRVDFKNKIITSNVIRNIGKIIMNEVENLNEEEWKSLYLNFSLDSIDRSFESQSIIIFAENGLLEQHTIRKVSMKFQTLSNSKHIEVQFNHSQPENNLENFILVSGDDVIWVNGVLSTIQEKVNNAETQSKLGWLKTVSVLLIIGLNILYFFLFFKYFIVVNSELLLILMVVGIPILSLYLMSYINIQIDKIWPSLELQTGAEHMKIAKKKRQTLWLLFSSLGIPIIMYLIDLLLKELIEI
jgi:hypothetical protein